jgi:hypothetical protein
MQRCLSFELGLVDICEERGGTPLASFEKFGEWCATAHEIARVTC